MSESISCPECGAEIPLTEAISHQVEERLRSEFEATSRAKEAEHAHALAEMEAVVEARIASARAEIETAAAATADERVGVRLADLSAQVAEKDTRLAEAQRNELILLKEKRKLEAQREALELGVARKMDEERASLVASTTERLEEEHRLTIREKDLRLEQMNKRIEELRAAADQKRSGLQGEVLEREIEDVLREGFPSDLITPVKSGKRGADVLQQVRSSRGGPCGTLLWESKNAKNWADSWVEKLKSDQHAEKATVAIIVSSVFPDGEQRMVLYNGVWVCDFASAKTLATVLRLALIEINQARSVDSNRALTTDAVYDYLCSKDFQHRLAGIVQPVVAMKNDLDTERRSTERLWAKREKHIESVMRNSAGIYGELQAIVGEALQPVPTLELPAAADEDGQSLALAS